MHLWELEDQAWFPTRLRDDLTDCLESINRWLGLYDACLPILERLLARTGEARVVDLCSGGGGPWARWLMRGALPGARILLTDRYPNLGAFRRLAERHPRLDFRGEPVDATAVPGALPGVRTLFTALHHLSPGQALALFGDAASCGQPLAAFDFNQRRWRNLWLVPPLAWLLCWLVTPFSRPWRLRRWLLTYGLPVIPAAVAWDGLVSQLRSYSLEELRELAGSVESPSYDWEVGSCSWRGVMSINYVLGYPVK